MNYVITVFAFVIVITVCTLNTVNCERVVIKTRSNERIYNFFPLHKNYLEFDVKASNDVLIILTEMYSFDGKYYEIVLGGWANSKSVIRKDTQANVVVSLNGPVINVNNFEKYWVLLDKTRGTVSVGKGTTKKLLMYYKDPDFVSMSYFGVSTGHGSSGVWYLDSTMFVPPCANTTDYSSV